MENLVTCTEGDDTSCKIQTPPSCCAFVKLEDLLTQDSTQTKYNEKMAKDVKWWPTKVGDTAFYCSPVSYMTSYDAAIKDKGAFVDPLSGYEYSGYCSRATA